MWLLITGTPTRSVCWPEGLVGKNQCGGTGPCCGVAKALWNFAGPWGPLWELWEVGLGAGSCALGSDGPQGSLASPWGCVQGAGGSGSGSGCLVPRAGHSWTLTVPDPHTVGSTFLWALQTPGTSLCSPPPSPHLPFPLPPPSSLAGRCAGRSWS